MEAGALSYRIISAGANIGNLVVPGGTERVPSIVMQFQIAVWVSYQTDFVSVMTMLCSLLKMGSILRDYFYGYETISEPWSLDGSGTEWASC